MTPTAPISVTTLVSLALRLGLEGPIAGYRVEGDRIVLWDLHGRTATASLAAAYLKELKVVRANKKPAKPRSE